MMIYIQNHWQFITNLLSFLSAILSNFIIPRQMINSQQDKSDSLLQNINDSAYNYTYKFMSYLELPDNPLPVMIEVDKLGNKYFTDIIILSDRINEGILNAKTVKNTHLPRIKQIVETKIIEKHYQQLENKTSNQGYFIYDKARYASILNVYNKFICGETAIDYKLRPLQYIWQKLNNA